MRTNITVVATAALSGFIIAMAVIGALSYQAYRQNQCIHTPACMQQLIDGAVERALASP